MVRVQVIETSKAGQPGAKGDTGETGPSAYEVAVATGFVGTEAEWIASLKGEPGEVQADDPRLSRAHSFDEPIAYARTFEDGRRSFVEFDPEGKPTAWSATLIHESLDDAGLAGGDVTSINGAVGDVVLDADDVLPDQTGHEGHIIISDGITATWSEAPAEATAWPEDTGSVVVEDFSEPWTVIGNTLSQEMFYASPRFPTALRITSDVGVMSTVRKTVSLDLRNRFLSFWVRLPSPGVYRLFVALWVNGGLAQRFEGTLFYSSVIDNDEWRQFFISPQHLGANAGGLTTPGYADLANVTTMQLSVEGQAGFSGVMDFTDMRLHDYPTTNGGVIWMFDDGFLNTYDEAFPRLSAIGHRGSTAVVANNASAADGTGAYMSLAQLQDLYDAGWDLCNHTLAHSISGTSMAAARAAIEGGRDFLLDNGWTHGHDHLVYPGGFFNNAILQLVPKYARTARTVAKGQSPVPYIADWYRMGSSYITKGQPVADLMAGLERAAEYGLLVYYTFHNLVTTPVATEDYAIVDFDALVTQAGTLGLASYTPSEMWPNRANGVSRR